MCGLIGIGDRKGAPVPRRVLSRMTNILSHRGPDSSGEYVDGPVGLGHRRLSIIDLSPLGHQPMTNEDGGVVIAFNGEIYNHQDLRAELEAAGHIFRSKSDTETIVHAYEEWGVACVRRFNGMFAFAIWDQVRRRIVLARDRYGIKPLYWYFKDGLLLFASEIKAILEHPAVTRGVCYAALNEYFTFQNVFSDRTMFEGIRLLSPASTLIFDLDETDEPVPTSFWDYPFHLSPLDGSKAELEEELHRLFDRAVTRQLMSDVPVGSYLSGGMDSGSIAAVAARHLPQLATFTGGFDLSSASALERGFDERQPAAMMARQFRTDHHELVIHAGDMEWVLPKLIWHQEDLRVGQCYPNYYVARMAGRVVKVCLSGAGGDELFGGYPWRYYRGIQSTGREDYFRRYYDFWQRLVPDKDKSRLFSDDVRQRIGSHRTVDAFRAVFNHYPGTFETKGDYLNASLYFELKTFLHGLLLVEDKVSMAHGLETRVPFLDNDLVEFACRIPPEFKVRDLARGGRAGPSKFATRGGAYANGKAILRDAMSRFMPAEVTARQKQGFSAPDASWFRGESIDYIYRVLANPRARLYEYVNPAYVRDVLDQHCSGVQNCRLLIWSFLSLEWWLANYFPQ
jgi:asparagine synthase (glutamine-hydrolysing)